MSDHFFSTAKRMYKSSETLHNNGEYHNACYCAGYVIECYAKILIGLSYNDPTISREYSHALNKLDDELQYILTHSSLASHIVQMRTYFPTIVRGENKWHPLKRYFIESQEFDQPTSEKYKTETTNAIRILSQMSLDTSSNLI